MKKVLNLFFISFQCIVIGSLIGIVYGFVRQGLFTLAYVFNSNFIIGSVITATGILFTFMPVILKNSKLIDHSTIGQKYLEAREKRQHFAVEVLCLGIGIIILTGTIQLVLAFII